MQMDTDTADADANDLEAGNVHEEEQHRQLPGSDRNPRNDPQARQRRRRGAAAKMRAQSSTRTDHENDGVVCLSSDEVHASSDEAAAQTPAGAAPVVAKTKQSASELHTT